MIDNKLNLSSLRNILNAIQNKEISYGINKEYCFVTDEDGKLVFLRKTLDNPHQKDLDIHGEERDQWPENSYDGDVIWKFETYQSRGLGITELFLKSLDIDFIG